MKTDNFSNIIIPVGIIGLLLIGGKKILDALGITASKTDTQIISENNAISKADYWQPAYYKKYLAAGKTCTLITAAGADALVTDIYEAHKFYNDDEARIYGAFAKLHCLTQVSYLAEKFNAKYSKDLLGFLYGGGGGYMASGILSEAEFNTLATIISKFDTGVK